MKDLETLLSLIAGLLYWVIKTYNANQRNVTTKNKPETWSEPLSKPHPLSTTIPTLAQAQPMPTFQDITSRRKAKPRPAKLSRGALLSEQAVSINQIEKKLARYPSLQRSIIIHEIMQSKLY